MPLSAGGAIPPKVAGEFSTTMHHEEGKMGTRFIGVDVGISGAIAILDPDTQQVSFCDTPSLEVVVGKKLRHVHDTYEMVRILKDAAEGRQVMVTV